jgi:hypothetical protein
MNNHCCKAFQLLIGDPEVPIEYYSEIRAYDLIVPPRFLKKNEFAVGFAISHCPRCGTELPRCLADEREMILKRDYGLTDLCDEEQKKHIPEEFKTDVWWKKRGL